ncbi:hypothetical protein QBC38DRAFT_449723 [Podospora fimiseda]|uniref:Uncharacterized protein n=1 Tax=Podospora fimiseda TaxID=252190 RepID=A0AAN6YLX1_9PEZI|nr:hypothetical protein QBC38DRAFT_449723 [Podospora fimiseda]
MKTSAIASTLIALLGFAAAAPAPEPEPSPEPAVAKRAPYNVFIGEHSNWGGRNELLTLNTAVCHTLGNGWPGIITAFGPDAPVVCTIFDRPGCTGSQFHGITNPGYSNLNAIGWNDRISSFRCV